MVYVEDDVINLTHGDDAALLVPLASDDGEPYELAAGDSLAFSVRQTPGEGSPLLLEAFSEPGSNLIELRHEDTDRLAVGFYSAEIQLTTGDGRRVTVWPKLSGRSRVSQSNRRNFCVMTEVVLR